MKMVGAFCYDNQIVFFSPENGCYKSMCVLRIHLFRNVIYNEHKIVLSKKNIYS